MNIHSSQIKMNNAKISANIAKNPIEIFEANVVVVVVGTAEVENYYAVTSVCKPLIAS